MNAGASLSAVPSPIEGSGTAWVLLGSWALSPARPTPIPPRHECRGFSALLVTIREIERRDLAPLAHRRHGSGGWPNDACSSPVVVVVLPPVYGNTPRYAVGEDV